MPNWNEILAEINQQAIINNQAVAEGNPLDVVRRRYLMKAHSITGRNTIAYYSGFLQKTNIEQTAINDNDKTGLMTVVDKLDRRKGLDFIIHTQGGDLAAAESIVDYLKQMFGKDIRAIVPQIAMSAGTMIACACKSIIMGKHSNLGPIDPQFRGISAAGVVAEFERAMEEVNSDPKKIPIWQVIIAKYHPTFIGECEKAIVWSKQIVTNWLLDNMLENHNDAQQKADEIVKFLSEWGSTTSHSRHIGINDCEHIGLDIVRLEDLLREKDFQDCILSIHHSFMHTFSNSTSVKIIENHNGVAMVQHYSPPPQAFPQVLPAIHPPIKNTQDADFTDAQQ
jgi:ATP-dependent protease ClpP protease subunit